MAKAIGIDLGTTNSVAGIKKGDIKILLNREGEETTESCVGWYKSRKGDGQVLVGGLAIDKMLSAPKDTIISIKRLMGRAYSDPDVQKVKEKFLYEVVLPSDGTDDDLRVVMGCKQYSPIQISSMILKKIKADAEERLNDKVEQAVITVPAYFTDKQIDATRKAGWLAGLKVQRVLAEPTAAAIAYGVDNIDDNAAKTILIYDLGGGTFDVSILSIAGGVFAELGKTGNMWLGGDDFDQKIIDYVIEKVEEEYGIDIEKIEESKRRRFKLALKKEAEKAKRVLSSTINTDITMIGMLEDEERNLIDVVVDLSRDQFEQMIQNDIKKSIELVRTAIKNAYLSPEQIDNVILVGGSTMIPMTKRALTDVFDKDRILVNVDPMKCVAQGAGILAARLGEEIECPECKTPNPINNKTCLKCKKPLSVDEFKKGIDVFGLTPMDYGVMTVGDKFEPVIKKGSPYPTPEPVVETFYTSADNMRRIKVPVYALDENENKFEHQAIVWLEIPERVSKGTPVDVAFELDDDCILKKVKVSFKDGSGREVEVSPDRGNEKRSRVEKKLDEMKQRWNEKQKDADSNTQQEIDELYGEAIRAANADDIDAAEKKVSEFEKKVEKIGKGDKPPKWKMIAEGITVYTDFLIEQYGWLIDPQKTYKIKKLVEELKSAADKNDQKLAEQKTEELNKEINALPGIVGDLMAIIQAIGIANSKGDVVIADKVRGMLGEIEGALKRNDVNTVKKMLNEIFPIVNEIYKSEGVDKPAKRWDDERLTKLKKGFSSTV